MPMDILNFPTKRNLLLARERLALARKGYDLLDKKRQVLVNELQVVQGQVKKAWDELHEALDKAHIALNTAQAEMGKERMKQKSAYIGQTVYECKGISFRSVMGVDLPVFNNEPAFSPIRYELHNTTTSLDEAVLCWRKARQYIIAWAAIDNTIYRLRLHIKKTQKRANALGNIAIPMYVARIKYIEERLEERERDDLARLKLVKTTS